jgi:hypothetical protein
MQFQAFTEVNLYEYFLLTKMVPFTNRNSRPVRPLSARRLLACRRGRSCTYSGPAGGGYISLSLIRMTKDEKGLAFFKGLLL